MSAATYMRAKDGEEGWGGGVMGVWTSRVRRGEEDVV